MRKSRILSLLLAVAVTATMLVAVPLTASAAESPTVTWDPTTEATAAIDQVDPAPMTVGSGLLTVDPLPVYATKKNGSNKNIVDTENTDKWAQGTDRVPEGVTGITAGQNPQVKAAEANDAGEYILNNPSDSSAPNCGTVLKVNVKEAGTLTANMTIGYNKTGYIMEFPKDLTTGGKELISKKTDEEPKGDATQPPNPKAHYALTEQVDAEHDYYVYVAGSRAVFGKIEFTPADSGPKEWTNNSEDTAKSSVTEDEENGYILSYDAGFDCADGKAKGFSYDLTDEITDLPQDAKLSSLGGVITVSFEIQRPADALTSSNYFVTVSGGKTMPGWSNTDSNTYGVLTGYRDEQKAYLYGGQNNKTMNTDIGTFTTENADDQNEWVKVSFKIDLKTNIFTGTRAESTSGLFNIEKAQKTDKLYLNVNPSDTTKADGKQTIKIKNITATYTSPEYTESVFGNGSFDSGIYTSGETRYAVIRYFQGYTGQENIDKYGFYFVDKNGVVFATKDYVINGTDPFNIGDYDGFYGDLNKIEQDDWNKTFYAKAYVVIDGVPYFSENIPGTVKQENKLTEYSE